MPKGYECKLVDFAALPAATNVRDDSGAMRSRATAANLAVGRTSRPMAARQPRNSLTRPTSSPTGAGSARSWVQLDPQRRGDAVVVKRRVAPCVGERPRPLHPQVQVVLERVTDRAMALQREATHSIGRL